MDIPRTYEPAELMAENSLTEEKSLKNISPVDSLEGIS